MTSRLLAGPNDNNLSKDDVKRGFITPLSGVELYKWQDEMYRKRILLTNEAEKIQLTKDFVQILNSDKFSNYEKCEAAYLIGLFQLKDGIKALVSNFKLWNEGADPFNPIYNREGEFPAQKALIEIGEQATSGVMDLIESTTNSFLLNQASWVILRIKGHETGVEFLKQSIADQPDSKKKENLKAALASEYFTDPKYRLSGPKEKVKTMLTRESQNVGVTNKPEGK